MRTLMAVLVVLAAVLAPATQAGATRDADPAAVVPCAAGQLAATYTFVPFSNATGHVEYLLTVTNRSRRRSCAFPAPLRLTLLGRRGQPLPTTQHVVVGGSYEVVLAPGQWAQATSQLSPDLYGPGEPAHGNCEPIAHALRIGIGDATIRAPMDPTPVCEHGALEFGRLRAVRRSPSCAASSLRASFKRDFPPDAGLANYTLTLRNTGRRCHTDSIVGVRLLGAGGQRLPTRVGAEISSPYVFARHAVQTATATLRTRPTHSGRCDPPATALAVTPSPGAGTLSTAVRPPLRACNSGLIELSGLFRNG